MSFIFVSLIKAAKHTEIFKIVKQCYKYGDDI